MKIVIVHALMSVMGGGDRLCCETIRFLKARGCSLTLLSADFNPARVERFFGFRGLFDGVEVKTYPSGLHPRVGRYQNLIHHIRRQREILRGEPNPDLIFSTQDPGLVPDIAKPVLQWGYFPLLLPSGPYWWPLRTHLARQIRRIGLVLAISEYSKIHLDRAWRIPSRLVYPPCNMIDIEVAKSDTVVTAARGVPEKRLDLFWEVARKSPDFEFCLLLTRDPRFTAYARNLVKAAPQNAYVILDPEIDVYHMALARSKLYLHLMEGEHFGITVVEAMSAGCVPIVHDSGGPKEIVGDSGFLWQREDEIPSILVAASNQHKLMSQMAKVRAMDFKREKFDAKLGSILERIA